MIMALLEGCRDGELGGGRWMMLRFSGCEVGGAAVEVARSATGGGGRGATVSRW